MNIWKSLSGMLIVEFTGADPDKSLSDVMYAQIPVSHVEMTEALTCRMMINRRDYGHLSSILQRRGDLLKVIGKQGLFWKLKELIHRPVLLWLLLLFLFLSLFLPTRILFITVEGYEKLPERLILSAAEACDIYFGASRRLVRSEKVKNALLSSVPQLQWVGINTSGCTAVISVRERIEEEGMTESNVVSNIIAERDGNILSATVTGGTAHFKIGDTVRKGQLLVSGYTDCGICIQTTRAEGEIMAQTNRKLTAVMLPTYMNIDGIQKENYKISLLVGKKRINFRKDSRISNVGCGRMYEEYYFSLPGGFQLPIGIGVDRYLMYDFQKTNLSKTEAAMQLKHFSDTYLQQSMIAGQMIRTQQSFFGKDGLYRLECDYVCTEMIGREHREQIGDIHEQRN